MIASCRQCGIEVMRSKSNPSNFCSVTCRFWFKVECTDGCWNWVGGKPTNTGYGTLMIDRRNVLAHRLSYEMMVGPIPDGLDLDHLCRNRLCVNPDHLEAVTRRENWLRGENRSAVTYRTGICQRGHSMEDAIQRPNGDRTCRKCMKDRKARYYRESKLSASSDTMC